MGKLASGLRLAEDNYYLADYGVTPGKDTNNRNMPFGYLLIV